MYKIGYFVSEHGFGHAARSCAIIQKLILKNNFHITIFSSVPKWFFTSSLIGNFEYIPMQTDIGIIQKDPFQEDLEKTIDELVDFYPISDEHLRSATKMIQKSEIELIISDISPLGLLAASVLKIPSMLIENFTWDWIYESYQTFDNRFAEVSQYLGVVFSKANFHIQTEPLCARIDGFPLVQPIYRNPRMSRTETRALLNVPDEAKLVLITMGGIPLQDSLVNIKNFNDYYFLIPGLNILKEERNGKTIALPHNHGYFHPDLVNASDIVIGKVGYSTIAEVYSCGVEFFFIGRDNFRESVLLEQYIQKNLSVRKIDLVEFVSGDWLKYLPYILDKKEAHNLPVNGAVFVVDLISKQFKKI